jgi:hypothetical protein
MERIGFSTGALAKGDFERGIALQRHQAIHAIELSALREHELPALAEHAQALELNQFDYVSVHAPSKLTGRDDAHIHGLLQDIPPVWPVIAHPEILVDENAWRSLGNRLCLENMDNRKATGRTVEEMRELFRRFPDARFCLDLGHARQIDPTMATALRMLREFRAELIQIHLSEVGPHGEHLPLSALVAFEFGLLAPHIPESCPIIIESVIPADRIARELATARQIFRSGEKMRRSSIIATIAATI